MLQRSRRRRPNESKRPGLNSFKHVSSGGARNDRLAEDQLHRARPPILISARELGELFLIQGPEFVDVGAVLRQVKAKLLHGDSPVGQTPGRRDRRGWVFGPLALELLVVTGIGE